MAASDLTAARLRELLRYDPETGRFTWLVTTGKARPGQSAGQVVHPNAQRTYARVNIGIAGRCYKAHRLAWLYVYGSWPSNQIDHINGDSLDNRIENLRDVTNRVNLQNQRRTRGDTISGLLGAHWDTRRKNFRAHIRTPDGVTHYLGAYPTAQEAHSVYLSAKRRLHEGCAI